MVIWIGQIACHSAIQQPGCSMRTANRWGVFISFLTMPWEKKNKPTSSAQMVTWIFLALIPKAPPQILLLVIIRMNPSQDPGQEVPRALSGAHSTMESTGELQHCMVPMHAASASFHAWESALPGIAPLPVRSFPAPRPPHAAAHGKDPSGGWLGFNVPKSSQSLPPYCLPHWHFFLSTCLENNWKL